LKIPDKKLLRQTFLKLVDVNEFEILGIQIIKSIIFDSKKIKGDKKYELLFDVYKEILNEKDFNFISEEAYREREEFTNEKRKYHNYQDYDEYKKHFIKTNIFKKFKSPLYKYSTR
jgi:hypothetical protein